MNGNQDFNPLTFEQKLKTAQIQFDAHRYDAASSALPPNPSRDSIAQHPKSYAAYLALRNAIEDQMVDAYLRETIPLEFRALDPASYPSPESLAKAHAFRPGPYEQNSHLTAPGFKGGLLLHGTTGTGKTRAAFSVLSARCHEDPWLKFRYVSAPDLKRRLADAARAGRANSIIDDLLDDKGSTLFIDDLSQARFTASFAENLFELVDRIYINHIELIVTVQTTGKELVRKWCADDKELLDTATAIERRFRDYCHTIRFTNRHAIQPTPPSA